MQHIGIRLKCADNVNWQDDDQKREFEDKRQELAKQLHNLGATNIEAITGISVFADVTEEQLNIIRAWQNVNWYFSEGTYKPAQRK